jgi:O-Antigen ligase
MIRDLLLALGLVLANATQLRLPGLPIGLGELFLFSWLGLTVAYEARKLNPQLNSGLFRLAIFWLVFAFAQSVGWFMGLIFEDFPDTSSAIHTAIAYVLMAALSCCAITLPDTWNRLRRVIWTVCFIGSVSVTVLLACAYGLVPLPRIEPWIWARLRGWSENPNQFAFLCTALALMSLHLAETAKRKTDQLVALALSLPPFVAGILTKSDSFILLAMIALPLLLFSKLWIWLFSAGSRLTFRTTLACISVLAIPAALVAVAPFAPTIINKAQTFASATMEQNNQAENRFKLWSEATQIGLEAKMLGLGPGPHLVNKQWKRPPPDKFEAHNTILDLFTQGGLIAAASFLLITSMAFFGSLRSGHIALAMLIFSLFVFSNFHFRGRDPVFWFTIALCLAAVDHARRSSVFLESEPVGASRSATASRM